MTDMQKSKIYSIKNLRSWEQYKKSISKLTNNWIFRGQSDSSWDLKTSIERTDFIKLYPDIEQSFVLEFQRGARNFLNIIDIPDNLIEWLALMQHHGAPTRLLDFTKSALIAAFFAFEDLKSNAESVAIWCINQQMLMHRLEKDLNLLHDDEFEKKRSKFSDKDYEASRRRFTNKDFEDIFYYKGTSCLIPIEPFKMNKRYALQQSVFISPGNSLEPLMDQFEFFGDDISKAFLKICLPMTIRKEALQDLQKMNITRTTLFPDLDGFSQGLKMKYDLFNSFGDAIMIQHKSLTDNKNKLYP